jgi:cell division protein FtsW (lipid II flippase)
VTAPVAHTRGSRRAADAWRDLSTGARAVVATVLALVVYVAGLVTWQADSGASAALGILAWVMIVAGVVAPVAALVLGAIAVRTGSGRALGAVALVAALAVLCLVGISTMGGLSV